MNDVLIKEATIEAIIKEAKKLDKLELQILLTKLRIKKIRKAGVKPVLNPEKKVAQPTMQQIDAWKHESRKLYADR